MRTSQAGLDLIKRFEGFEADAYRCPAGVLTIGYGSTGPHVREGMSISEAEAEELLRQDVRTAEIAVERNVTLNLAQHEFDALVSFTFNLGEPNLRESTLLRKLNEGDREGTAVEFDRWVFAAGKKLLGLVRRRTAEQRMFLGLDA